ncbi:Hypothetical protein FKW44_004230 [Caligus rogercresseyi]|uniref:Uncharacterized protein n=1 Tax=Caligus rogercresseyi TaxID=217165 RepID=A0A7T8HLM7_CALRO|nr:Hypothetical protein FKW44_004230 [Caligus rogercresseyi]
MEESPEKKEFDLMSMLEVLDGIERGIEVFKVKAVALAEEQSSLESTLGIIISDFESQKGVDAEEVLVRAQSLSERLFGAAEILSTKALREVNNALKNFSDLKRKELEVLMNSTLGMDPSDRKFEGYFHACSIDDQKLIRTKLEKRLQELCALEAPNNSNKIASESNK